MLNSGRRLDNVCVRSNDATQSVHPLQKLVSFVHYSYRDVLITIYIHFLNYNYILQKQRC